MPVDQPIDPEAAETVSPPKRRPGRPPRERLPGEPGPKYDYSGVHLLKWADEVLAAHGLRRGERDETVAALGAAAEARGWGHATEEHPQRRRERRWRATVYRRDAPGARAWVTGGATANAPAEDEALAIALARMLARPVREPEAPAEPSADNEPAP
jgi:hypothetical protein